MTTQHERSASLEELIQQASAIEQQRKTVTDDQLRAFLLRCESLEEQSPSRAIASHIQTYARSAASLLAQRLVPQGIAAITTRITARCVSTGHRHVMQDNDAFLVCRFHDHTANTRVPKWAITAVITHGTRQDLLRLVQRGIEPSRAMQKLSQQPDALSNQELIELLDTDCAESVLELLSVRVLSETELQEALTTARKQEIRNEIGSRLLESHQPSDKSIAIILRFCCHRSDLEEKAVDILLSQDPSSEVLAKVMPYCQEIGRSKIASAFVNKVTAHDVSKGRVHLEERIFSTHGHFGTPRSVACHLIRDGIYSEQLIPLLAENLGNDDALCYICLYWPENMPTLGEISFQEIQNRLLRKCCGSYMDFDACKLILASDRADLLSLRRKVAENVLPADNIPDKLLALIEHLGTPWKYRVAGIRREMTQKDNPLHGLDI